MDDFFSAESLLLDRLQTLQGAFRLITTARSQKALQDQPGPVPALYLVYDGQEPFLGAGQEQAIDQQWLLITVVRTGRETVSGSEERAMSGPLLIQLCETLIGWQPGAEYGPLTFKKVSGPLYHNGYGFYPLRVSTRLILRGL